MTPEHGLETKQDHGVAPPLVALLFYHAIKGGLAKTNKMVKQTASPWNQLKKNNHRIVPKVKASDFQVEFGIKQLIH